MNYLTRKLHIYWPFSKSIMQAMMSYRVNFFMFVFGNFLKTFVVYYLWKAVFYSSTSSTLSGFTLQEMIIYIFISSITAIAISNNIDGLIGEEVRDGSIAMNLIRPINYQVRLLFQSFGTFVYQFAFVSIPIWLALIITRYTSIKELPPDIGTILLFLLSLMLGFMTLFLFNFCFGLLAFHVTGMWGLRNLKRAILSFISGELIPIAFFPLWFQKGLRLLPFSSMNYTPVMIYLKKLTGAELIQTLATQIVWIFILFFISRWMWNKAIKHLTILGG